jgi:hypothetical protein
MHADYAVFHKTKYGLTSNGKRAFRNIVKLSGRMIK